MSMASVSQEYGMLLLTVGFLVAYNLWKLSGLYGFNCKELLITVHLIARNLRVLFVVVTVHLYFECNANWCQGK